MNPDALDSLAIALDHAGIRYVIVGGLAVAAHGYLRFAATLDLMIPAEVEVRDSATKALAEIGYSIPDKNTAESAIRRMPDDRGPEAGETIAFGDLSGSDMPMNLIYTGTADFEVEYEAARRIGFRAGRSIPFLSLDSLIRRKVVVGSRPDADDLEHLRWIDEDRRKGEEIPVDPWDAATWDGSRRAQLRRWTQLSLEQIVSAQEEMTRLATMMRRITR